MVIPCGHADKRRHRHHLVAVGQCRRHRSQVLLVVTVHSHDKVEILKVAWMHLTADMVKGQASAQGMHSHPLVGQLPHMPAAGAGRVYLPPLALAA